MKDIQKLTDAYTHGSIFHADDVFATALLLMLNPGLNVHRIVSVEDAKLLDKSDANIVYDIGEGEYDHHQKDAAVRPFEDGWCTDKDGRVCQIKYCSFGLLWRDYGRKLCPNEKAWKKVDRDLVLEIDRNDNGVGHNLLTSAFMQFNPNWNDDCSNNCRDRRFLRAESIAFDILAAYICRANAEVEAEEAVKASTILDDKILVLDKYMPWQDVVVNEMPDILFVVFPSARGGWNVQTVPDAPGSFNGRKLFPKEWLGNPDASLGMTFCHPGNFLLATETKEQSINCARIAIKAPGVA